MDDKRVDKDAERWNSKAIAAAIKAEKMLWGKHNETIQAWMYESGLSLATMKKAHLGWQVRNTQRPAESWGIPGIDKVQLPQGITIPIIEDKTLKRIVIYRMGHGHDGDYHTVEGSTPAPLVLDGNPKRVALVRGELDALLLHQELKGEWTVIALGQLPPPALEETLAQADEIRLITMINDGERLTPWQSKATSTHTLKSESLITLARSGVMAHRLTSIFG